MTSKTERLYVWSGIVGSALIGIGLVIAKLIPPPAPNESAAQLAAFYRHNATALRWGSVIMASGAAMFGPWLGVLTRRLKRIEGHGSATAYCELALGALLIFEIVLPLAILQVVVFRPDRSPSETLILSDLFVLLFISPVYTFLVELLVTGVAILRDKQEHPVFPAWMGMVNFLVAVLSVPGIVVIFVKSGPFTWSGALGFWVPAVAFGIWVIVMSVGLLSPAGDSASEAPGLSAQAVTAI